MQSFTAESRLMLQGGVPLGVSISVDALSGMLTITQDDMIQDSFAINRSSVSGQTIEIGNADASELVFLLDNDDRRFDDVVFEGAELTVTLSVGAASWVAGIFTVDQPPQGIDTISVAALDNMARFDRPYSTLLTDRASLLAILQDSCAACGVVLGTTSFTNSDYLAVVPVDVQISHRQVVAWVAQLAGSNAWVDQTGALRLSWYGDNQGMTEIEVTTDDYNIDGYSLAENDVALSGLIWRTADTDYLWGTSDYALPIEGNILIDMANYDDALAAVYNKINGFFYRPFSIDTVPAPWLWQMDMIQLTTITGQVIPSIVTGNRIMLRDGSKIAAEGETSTVAGYAAYSPFTDSQRSAIQKTTREVLQVFGVNAEWINAGLIDADRIAAQSISADKLAVGAIVAGSAVIADGAIDTAQIADGSITDAKIVGMTANKITAGTIDAAEINVVNLNADNLTVGSINGQRIADGAISAEKLASEAVTADKVAVGAISAKHIADGSITGEKIASGSIKESQLNWSTHLLF